MLARSPYIPSAISFEMLGTSAARSSNRSCGVPQSRPMTATRGPCCMRRDPPSSLPRPCVRRAERRNRGRARRNAGRLNGSRMLPTPPKRRPRASRRPRSMTVLRRALGLGAVLLLAAVGVPLVVVPRTIVEESPGAGDGRGRRLDQVDGRGVHRPRAVPRAGDPEAGGPLVVVLGLRALRRVGRGDRALACRDRAAGGVGGVALVALRMPPPPCSPRSTWSAWRRPAGRSRSPDPSGQRGASS